LYARSARRPAGAGLILGLLFLSVPARAQDPFEIQVYNSETAAPRESGFELHLNTSADRFTHMTLEPHVGLNRWLEAGAYFQTQLDPDGTFHYEGVKLRLKMRVPRLIGNVLGLALNVEVSSEPSEGFAGEARPILDLQWKRLYLAVNPIVSFTFAGEVDFEPAAKFAVILFKPLSVGAEYYGSVREHIQRIFGAFDVDYGRIGLNFGAGYSFGDDKWIVKAIVGLTI
jgi:hypothetical protein